jgi:hypothetical protein
MRTNFMERTDTVRYCDSCGLPLLDNEGIDWMSHGYQARVCCRSCLTALYEAKDHLVS